MKNILLSLILLIYTLPALGQTTKPLPIPKQSSFGGTTPVRKITSAPGKKSAKPTNTSASRSKATLNRTNSSSSYKPSSYSLGNALETCNQRDVAYFINVGNDVKYRLNNGETPLNKAIGSGCPLSTIRFLIQKGADVTLTDKDGFFPMHAAAKRGDVEIMKLLKFHGGNVNAERNGHRDENILNVAAAKGRFEACRWLLEQGVNVDAASLKTNTPLCEAAYNGSYEVCQLLLEKGANVNGYDGGYVNGVHLETPLDYAQQKGYTAIVGLLVQFGGKTQKELSK